MNIILITLFTLVMIPNQLQSNPSFNDSIDTKVITGIYDGFDGDNYAFIRTTTDDNEEYLFFPKIDTEILREYNLSEDQFKGKLFAVTFSSQVETEIDEDGYEQEYEVHTIIKLELLD